MEPGRGGEAAVKTACAAVALLLMWNAVPAAAQSGLNRTSPFLGIWCVSDDPSRRALITGGPFGLTLRLEHGSTSTGTIAGPFSHQVVAPQWNLLHGTLSTDEETITWSDNTYWTRCRPRINLEGTWYDGGIRSQPARIEQHGGALALRNELGQVGRGNFTARDRIAVLWSGILLSGVISADENRIDWDNSTYWTR